MSIGKVIIKDIVRPDHNVVEAFRGIPAANVGDCMERMASLGPRIRPIGKTSILGTAFTVRVPQGDNLMVHKAMDMAEPGDVLVIDAGGDMNRSIMGGLMTRYCCMRGLAGIVIDGCVRDYEELSQMGFPIYACGVSPNGPYKNGPGEINVPVKVGDQVVCPGDLILGDADGVVVIRAESAEAVLEAARDVIKKEDAIMDGIVRQHSYPRPWVDEKLTALGYENM